MTVDVNRVHTLTYREWRQQRKCGQKIQYSGKNVAATAAVALAWIGRHNLEPYECDYCQHWHLGHATKEE